MQEYFANFVKNDNPNGSGLQKWPATNSSTPVPVMHINLNPWVIPDQHTDRYTRMVQVTSK